MFTSTPFSVNQKGLAPLLLIILLLAGIGLGVYLVRTKTNLFPKASAPTNYINHILSTGQSLSVGADGCPSLTTTQPYNNLMLSGNGFKPLIEDIQNTCRTPDHPDGVSVPVETISSAMANTITANSQDDSLKQFLVSMHGGVGLPYTGIKKGTIYYQNGINQIRTAKQAAQALGQPYRVVATTIVHGESDHIDRTPKNTYIQDLIEWQNDYEADAKSITNQFGVIPLFESQMNSFTSYGSANSVIPEAQLEAADNNIGKIFLIGPKYFLNYADGPHLQNSSYRWLGEYYGKAIKKVIIDKEEWRPLSPRQISLNGNVITVKFYVPAPPIQFDTQNVAEQINKGFEYSDSSSNPPYIQDVSIAGPDSIKITLSQSLVPGSNPALKYAYTGINRSVPGARGLQTEFNPPIVGSARGNVRDSDNTPSLYSNHLYNWLVSFDKPVPFNQIGLKVVRNSCQLTTPSVELEWDDYSSTPNYAYVITRDDPDGTERGLGTIQNRSISGGSLASNTFYRYKVTVVSDNQPLAASTISLTTKDCLVNNNLPNPTSTSTPSTTEAATPTPSETAPRSLLYQTQNN